MPMAIVIEAEFQKDLPGVDRMIALKIFLAEWAAEGWKPDEKRSYLFKSGYPNIDDWDIDNVAFADGYYIALIPIEKKEKPTPSGSASSLSNGPHKRVEP
jgi:hypothetical protein